MRGLSRTQKSIVLHVNAYLTSCTNAVRRDCCPRKTITRVEEALRRLEARRFLQLIPDLGTSVLRLGTQAIKDFGFSSHRTKLPGPEALPRDLTIVRHCVFGDPKRDRLSPQELLAVFPEFPQHLLPVPWYIDVQQNQLVAMLVMGTGSGESVIKHLETGQQQLLTAGGPIAALLKRGQLAFEILTQDVTRQDQVRSVLPPSLRIPTRVVLVPTPDEDASYE